MDNKTEKHIWSMPGIAEIWMADTNDLQKEIMQGHIVGLDIMIAVKKQRVVTFEDAECEVETTWENNAQTEKASLQFSTTSIINTGKSLAWLIKDVSGQWWLMGSHEQPWPKTTISRNLGKPGGEKAARTVKVTLNSLVALIPVAVL